MKMLIFSLSHSLFKLNFNFIITIDKKKTRKREREKKINIFKTKPSSK